MLAVQPLSRVETMMRYFSVALASALTFVSISTALNGQQPDSRIDPRSLELLARGRALANAGDLDGATDTLETAVTVDPRNRAAFVTLGGVADRRGLPGKAIRLYREALLLEPNDLAALRGQGEALVQKGAVTQAKANLSRIRALCKTNCGDATMLAAVIAKGPPPIATAQVDTKSDKTPKE